MAKDNEERPLPAPNEQKSYAKAAKGNKEINPILQEYITMREKTNGKKKNKMEITFKKN